MVQDQELILQMLTKSKRNLQELHLDLHQSQKESLITLQDQETMTPPDTSILEVKLEDFPLEKNKNTKNPQTHLAQDNITFL